MSEKRTTYFLHTTVLSAVPGVSLVARPAAAVIPAPIAYIKVVVVKKLVVEPWAWLAGPPHRVYWSGRAFPSVEPHALHWVWRGNRTFTVKKLECSRQAYARIH